MRGLIAIVLLVIFGVVSAAVPTRLSFTKGQQIVYKLHGTVDARGNIETQGTTDGTTSTMDSVMVIKCVDMDSTSYTFVMNMFDTTVSVNEETSVVKVEEATSSSALGYDMYFQQAVTGEVQKIWYDTRDSQYFVNVKVSAINALQTTVTAPGTSQTVLESDPLGVHYSEFTGSASSNDDTLLVNKAFSQKDFEKFSDPDVTPKNVILMARAATGIHPSGFIQSAQTEQFATVDNMSRTSYSFGKAKGVNTNSTGFDMDMQSHGVLNIDYSSQSVVSSNAGAFFLNHAQSKKELETRDSIASVASLFDLAVAGVLQSKKEIPVFAADIESTLKQVLSSGSVKSQMNSIHKIVRFFKLTKEHKASQLLLPYFMELQKTRNAALREKLFIIATSLGDLNVYQQLAKYGLKGGDKEIQYHALLAITSGVRESSAHLIAAVFKIMNNEDTDAQVRDAAYMAYGSLLSYSDDRNFVTFGKNTLIGALKSAMAKNDNRMIVSALGAISNAGSAIVPVTEIPYTLFSHSELMVRTAAMFVLQKQAKKGSQSAKKIIDVLTAKDDPDYPYNKDYKVDWSVGGKTVSAKFDAELFVGTNFDCNHPTFNYKGLAEATGGVALFGVEQQVFDARALYAKKGSQLVGDELFLSVFDKVLFQKSIGALVDCTEHTYDLYHAAPGFSLSYTVWVSIVPITFRASASAVLDAKWGWQICDSQLSALVELVPSAELIVSGDAEIDLLIVKGELELDGTFAAAVVPQAYVHGTECAIGIDVKLNTQPMDAKLEAFYMIKKCKFLFFDCKWGPRDNHVFWEWQLPSKSDTLYDKEWKIGTD